MVLVGVAWQNIGRRRFGHLDKPTLIVTAYDDFHNAACL